MRTELALVIALAVSLAGSARAQEGTAGPAWSTYLLEFLPAVDACLLESAQPATVTRAWPMNHGMIGVRLTDAMQRRFDCIVPAIGGAPVIYEPVPEGEASTPVGNGQPVFTRAPGAPPPGACYEHEEVHDPATGEVLGWLGWDVC